MRLRPSRPAAFTLIEILLAVAIFSLVLVAIHSVFHTALRLRNRTVQSIEASLPFRQTLTILRRDLAGIVPPGGTFGGAVESTPVPDAASVSGATLIRFHSAVGVLTEDAPWGDIQRITYLLSPPTNGVSEGFDLVRAVTRNLLPVNQESVESQRLMSGVESVTFSFHDGSAWRTFWDSTNEVVALPTAIKAEFQLVQPRDAPQVTRLPPVELVVGLLIQPATNATTSSDSSSSQTGGPGGGA